MYLQKLEIQGFKSFASRAVLEFPSATGRGKGLTAVVGPNGSGKSNISDAIRWVLGEQSMKTLRSRKAEDVIFFGSDKKARVGMAEVSLYLNNEDGQAPIEYSEFVITRRLYRNGESEYLLNKQKVRLTDIQLLLARANFGQRTYSVIGQGMVDHFLVASQAERKEFFDEAAGVKEFQIKKQQTANQLKRTEENLQQTEITLQELGPRYRSLSRMVKRLEQRDSVEAELRALQLRYYGYQYGHIDTQWQAYHGQLKSLEEQVTARRQALTTVQQQLDSLEQEESGQDVLNDLQQQFTQLSEQQNTLRGRQLDIEHQQKQAKQQAASQFVPMSADAMAGELEELLGLHDELHQSIGAKAEAELKKHIQSVIGKLKDLLKRVKRPQATEVEDDPKLQQELETLTAELTTISQQVTAVQQQMRDFSKQQEHKKGAFFDLQRQFAAEQNELNSASVKLNDVKIELAKLDTRREDLQAEITREMDDTSLAQIKQGSDAEPADGQLLGDIQKMKRQLELIGAIDDESMQEFQEIKGRYEFLQEQFDDLTKAIADLRAVQDELDQEIEQRFDQTFTQINQKFSGYFQKLFGGGKASLEKILIEDVIDESTEEDSDEETAKPKKQIVKKRYGGVDIKACPPGKKIADLNTLSGGERAMTSIALICAIIASNPSPFVVLDEVDAALDEANSERYAAILEELSTHTQFIVVTHNRASMRRADVLYGVTMGDDSASKMLSVKLEQGEQWAK